MNTFDIEYMRGVAADMGDAAMVATCERALKGDEQAMREVARFRASLED